MSFEGFQMRVDTLPNTSNIKGGFMKLRHQHGAKLKDNSQSLRFFLFETSKYHQIGNGFLKFDITLRKNGNDSNKLVGDDNIGELNKLVNVVFAYTFRIATLSAMRGEDIQQNKQVIQVSTIMRLLTSKAGDLL